MVSQDWGEKKHVCMVQWKREKLMGEGVVNRWSQALEQMRGRGEGITAHSESAVQKGGLGCVQVLVGGQVSCWDFEVLLMPLVFPLM